MACWLANFREERGPSRSFRLESYTLLYAIDWPMVINLQCYREKETMVQ